MHVFNLLSRNVNRLDKKEFQTKYKTLVYDLDTSCVLKSHFYSLFLLRRFFFSLVVVVMHTHPFSQWFLIAL